jgi:hypothetical protein
VKVLVQEEVNGYPDLNKQKIPRSIDYAKSPEQRQILELAYSTEVFGRPYLMAAGVPQERVAAMRKAFMDTLNDPGFIADAKRMKLDVAPMSGSEVRKRVARAYATPADIVKKTRHALHPETEP